jgi:cytochrome c553
MQPMKAPALTVRAQAHYIIDPDILPQIVPRETYRPVATVGQPPRTSGQVAVRITGVSSAQSAVGGCDGCHGRGGEDAHDE